MAVLTACADAMRDLPLRKMPEEVILASQRRAVGEFRLKGLWPRGAFGVYDMVREDMFWLDKA